MDWFLKVVRDNYANFNGRARRKEYWMFTLFYVIFLAIASVLDALLGLDFTIGGFSLGYGWLYTLYTLALFIPSLAVGARRLHDTGKSGWWQLLVILPIIGIIILIVFFCQDSEVGENKWGKNPKENEVL